jgi:hypothetical protein
MERPVKYLFVNKSAGSATLSRSNYDEKSEIFSFVQKRDLKNTKDSRQRKLLGTFALRTAPSEKQRHAGGGHAWIEKPDRGV